MKALVGEAKGFDLVTENYMSDRTGGNYTVTRKQGGIMGMWVNAEGENRGVLPRNLQEEIQITKLGLGGEMKTTSPFAISNVTVSTRGGLDSNIIGWDNGSSGGVCCYRDLNSGNLIAIPYFRVLNQTGKTVFMEESNSKLSGRIEDGKDFVITESSAGMIMTFRVEGVGTAGPSRIKGLGTIIVQIKDDANMVVGAVRIDTFSGGTHARIVGRVEMWRRGRGKEGGGETDVVKMRLNLKGGEFRFNGKVGGDGEKEVRGRKNVEEGALDIFSLPAPQTGRITAPPKPPVEGGGEKRRDIMSVEITGVIVEFTRVFRKAREGGWDVKSKLMLALGGLQIIDENAKSEYRHVLRPLSRSSRFLDFVVCYTGAITAPLVVVDSLGFKVYPDVAFETSEDFAWRAVDFFGCFNTKKEDREAGETLKEYCDGHSQQLYHFKYVTLGSIKLMVSFKRKPDRRRYEGSMSGSGALVKYCTTRLKFSLTSAKLSFKGHESRDVKGPPSALAEVVQAAYLKQVKAKWSTIVSSVSLQQWKDLAGREGGGDEYEGGDVLRAVGKVAGKGVGKGMEKGAGGIADVFSGGVGKAGDGIETGLKKVGLGEVGKGVNNVASGLGDGVGNVAIGLGKGAGGVVMGVGQGAGQILGGVAGGIGKIGGGLKKGIVEGDGDGLLEGLGDGAMSVVTGFGGGVETAVTGVADGILSVGGGLWKGVRSIGKGVKDAGEGREKEKGRLSKRGGEGKRGSGKGWFG